MTVQEAKNAIKELKESGLTDEAIRDSLLEMYRRGQLDFAQFGALVKLVGYEVSKDFIDAEERRTIRSDISYALGKDLTVVEEAKFLRKILPTVDDDDIRVELQDALKCLEYGLSDEAIEWLKKHK